MRRGSRRAHARTRHHDCRRRVRDHRPSARLGVPAPGRVLSWGRASSEFGLDGQKNRRGGSSHQPQGVESRARTASSQKWQVVADLRNVRSVLEISSIFQPTDRPHLAAFILPSSVAGPQQPFSELESFENSQRALRQDAIPLIAIVPPLIGQRTVQPEAVLSTKNQPSTEHSTGVFDAHHVQLDRWRNAPSSRSKKSGATRQGPACRIRKASRSPCSEAINGVSTAT